MRPNSVETISFPWVAVIRRNKGSGVYHCADVCIVTPSLAVRTTRSSVRNSAWSTVCRERLPGRALRALSTASRHAREAPSPWLWAWVSIPASWAFRTAALTSLGSSRKSPWKPGRSR